MPTAARALLRLLLLLLAALSLVPGCQNLAGEFEVVETEGDGGPLTGDCKPGEWRCNREFLLQCSSAGKWEPKDTCDTPAQCDQINRTCTVCPQAGQRRCNGAMREVCAEDRSAWKELERCDAADQCSPTHCGPCTTGEAHCAGLESRDLQVCNADNRWQPVATCETAPLCERSVSMSMTDMSWTPACLPPVCEPGALSCDGSSLYRCRQGRDGLDRVDICSSPALCQMATQSVDPSAQMCPLGCGPAGSFRCAEDRKIEQCAFDQTGWQVVETCPEDMDCDPATGQCGARCAPGTHRCNAGALESCTPEQTWVVQQTCATPALCSIDPPSCIDPRCRPTERRCDPLNASALQECNEDQTDFVTLETCLTADLCACAIRGDCAAGLTVIGCGTPVCMPGMDGQLPVRCNPAAPLEVQVCNASLNAWDPLATCTGADEFCYPADRVDPCKTECPGSGLLCDGAELLACGLEGLMHQADCATATLCDCVLTGSCSGGIGATGCGSPVCGGTLASNQCSTMFLQTCQVGRNGWDSFSCGSEALCYPGEAPDFVGGYCAICETAGVVECMPNNLATRTCAPDRKSYVGETACQFGCLERPGPSADYCAACAPNELRCTGSAVGSRVQQCNADQTGLADVGSACTSGCLDLGLADACAACQANELRCDGTVLKRCNAARTGLDTVQTCNPSCIDKALEDHCGECVVGSKQCSGDNLQTCQTNGAWDTGSACTNGCIVKSGDDACAPLCRPGTFRCQAGTGTDARLEQCNANGDAWALVTTCTSNLAGTTGAALCDATNGRCDACVAGDYRCLAGTPNGTLQDCNANGDWKAASSNCSGTTLRTCGTTTSAATVQTCVICDNPNKQCDDCVSTANDFSCASGTLRGCTEDGHWTTSGTCSGGVCNCVGNRLRTCSGNTLNDTPCSSTETCNETANDCFECTPGNYQCDAGTLEFCDAGHWMPSAACVAGVKRTCSGNMLMSENCPSGQTCNAAQTECNMCNDGDTRCNAGSQQTCVNRTWGMTTPCPFGCPSTAMVCNECSPSSPTGTKCSANTLLTCGMNGRYPATGTACPNGCFGPDHTAYCGDCTPGDDTTCNSGSTSVLTCGTDGRYPTSGGTSCNPYSCHGSAPDAYCGTCSGSTSSCSGKQRQVCMAGVPTNNGAPCTGNCFNGACVECNVTADCSGGQVCDTAAHDCVACLLDTDCMGNAVCDLDTNTCVDCVDDDDCTGNEVCTADNECVECEIDADCGMGQVCNTPTNTCQECVDDSDCTTGGEVCDEATDTCVECTDDDECTGDEVCRLSDHTCVECTADAQCAPDVCNESTNLCVECMLTSDCAADEVCDTPDNVCVECLTSADCANNTPEVVCRTSDNTCVQCLVNTDCTAVGMMTCGPANTCIAP